MHHCLETGWASKLASYLGPLLIEPSTIMSISNSQLMQFVSPYRWSEPLCHQEAVIQEPEQLIITGGFLLRPSRLNLRLYESQLSSWWHQSFVVKGVISVINRDQSSPRTQPAHYTPLSSVHEQIRHNEAQLLRMSSHINHTVTSSNNTHTHTHNSG